MNTRVPDAVVRRLPGYYRHLNELERQGVTQISSQDLGIRMQLTASQIRHDIKCFGGFGRQGYGYPVMELKEHIARILGLNQQHRMILIGAGNMGSAVARYRSFAENGFRITAMFDSDPAKIGTTLEGIRIMPIASIEHYLNENEADIAVLALPAKDAQDMLDRLYSCGIRAVWNFAPTDLVHESDMEIVNVHLSDSLHILSYLMAHKNED